jgi:dGTPase
MKYPWLREGEHETDNKWGAYKSERRVWEHVRAGVGHDEPSLEAMLMDWADDISYAVHDLEDFFRVGQIPLARLLDDATEREDFVAKAVADIQAKQTRGFKAELIPKAIETLKTLLQSVSDYRATPAHQRAVQELSRALINLYVGAVEVRDRDAPLAIGDSVRHEVLMLKQLTWQYVIYNPALATLQEGHVRVVRHLFERLTEWLEQADADETAGKKVMHRLPPRLVHWYRLTAEEEGAEDAYGKNEKEAGPKRRARSVADYIASLTEVQALDLNERLHGSAPHSIMESWFRY